MSPATERPCAPTRPPRILVADDDADLRELLAEALREDGYEVVEENDGGRLLVRVAAVYAVGSTIDPIDLIISDVRMPVCSGLDILQGLRNAHWPTPVILMTGLRDAEVHTRAARLGAVVFDKPFELSVLREKVKDLLPSPLEW